MIIKLETQLNLETSLLLDNIELTLVTSLWTWKHIN